MGITWTQGRDSLGYNWLCATGDTQLPCVYWRDSDSPDQFAALAEQAADMAKMEREQAVRFARQSAMHDVQAQAFQAISEVLATGETTTVTIVPLERPILPERGDGE